MSELYIYKKFTVQQFKKKIPHNISAIALPFVGKELKSDSGYGFCFYRVMFLGAGYYFHKQRAFFVCIFDYFVFIYTILRFIIFGIMTCRYVLNFYILSFLVSKNQGLRLWHLYF